MALVSIPWNPSRKDLRIFAALQVLFFAFIAWTVWKRTGSTNISTWMMAISAWVGVIGLLAPAAIRWIYVGWMIAVFPIGWIVSHTIISCDSPVAIRWNAVLNLRQKLTGRCGRPRRTRPATSASSEYPGHEQTR